MIEKPITFGSSTINDRTYQSLNVAPYYYISVRSVDGFWGADIAYEAHPIPGKIGERSGDVFRRGKTITLTGMIEARGMAEYRVAQRYLQAMFWSMSPAQLKFYHWNDGSTQSYITCRVIQDLVMVDSKDNLNPNSTPRCQWTVALRADDPRTYAVSGGALHPSYQSGT